jgi:hypothetical protein
MKALLCGRCFDIRALEPEGAPTQCRCGNVTARWLDPHTGAVRVKANHPRKAFILGLNNRFLYRAVRGFNHEELVAAGGQWEAWRQAHKEATSAPGYIFDEKLRGCWACIVRVNETGDIKWEEGEEVFDECDVPNCPTCAQKTPSVQIEDGPRCTCANDIKFGVWVGPCVDGALHQASCRMAIDGMKAVEWRQMPVIPTEVP